MIILIDNGHGYDTTGRIMESASFNFVSEARSGMKAFVNEAAKSPVRNP